MGAGSTGQNHSQAARELLRDNRTDEALAEARLAVAANGRDGDAYLVLGLAQCRKGLLADGVASLHVAASLKPESRSAHQNLALASEATGAWEQALLSWRALAGLDPSSDKAQAGIHRASAKLLEEGKAIPPEPEPEQALASGGDWDALADEGPARAHQYNPGDPFAPPPPPPPGTPLPPAYGPPQGRSTRGGTEDPGHWSPETLLQIIAQPRAFFEEMRGHVTIGPPVMFVCINLALIIAIQAGGTLLGAKLHGGPASQLGARGWGMMCGGMCIGTIIGVPVALGLSFLGAAIYHLCMMIFGARGGFASTFRALAYSQVPSLISSVIAGVAAVISPMLAPLAMVTNFALGGWGLALFVIALSTLHETEWWQALIAALIPTAVAVFLTFVLVSAMLAKAGLNIRNLTPTGIRRGTPAPMAPMMPGPSGQMPGMPPGGMQPPPNMPGGWQ